MTLSAIYDLRYSPITFDFAVWLALVDCVRQLADEQAIDLTIRADGYRKMTKREHGMDTDEKRWRLKSILLSCCDLLPTLRDVTVQRSSKDGVYDFPANYPKAYTPSYRPPYLAADVLRLHGLGAEPKVLAAPAYAKNFVQKGPYVTLTLRTSKHFPERNIDLRDWGKFAEHIMFRGHNIIVVPDTEWVLMGGPRLPASMETYVAPMAALDQRIRLALYEGAEMNVCSSNGPAAMMFYSQAPVLQFDQFRGGVFNSDKWLAGNGFPAGGQFPWSTPKQRMTWTESSYASLCAEFDKVMDGPHIRETRGTGDVPERA